MYMDIYMRQCKVDRASPLLLFIIAGGKINAIDTFFSLQDIV